MPCVAAPKIKGLGLMREHRSGNDYRAFSPDRSREIQSPEWRRKSQVSRTILRTTVAVGVEGLFRARADRWRSDTDGLSAIEDVITHPDYLKIIGMGKPALPLILKELQEHGGRWHIALDSIAETSPVAPEDLGYTKRMKEAWIEWGRKNHYL